MVYKIKEVEPITIEFRDGKQINLYMDALAYRHLTEDFDFNSLANMNSYYEICIAAVYCSAVEHNEDITKEYAQELVKLLPGKVISKIVEEFLDSIGVDMKAEQKKTVALFEQIRSRRKK